MRVTFYEHLARALQTLNNEYLEYADAMWSALGHRIVHVAVGKEVVCLEARTLKRQVHSDGPHVGRVLDGEIHVVTTPAVILALADGERRLLEAILGDDVALWGSTDDLAAGREAFAMFLGGAVRCPSFPERLGEFRRWCNG